MSINELTEMVIGAAIEVHRHIGPGMLESAYQKCLCHELGLRGISFDTELQLQIEYKGISVPGAYRIDLLIDNRLLVELKAIEKILPIHEAQLLTYLKFGGWEVGLIINFHALVLKDGIRRKVYNLKEQI